MLQYRAILRDQRRLGEVDRGKHGASMRRIGIRWEMEPEGAIEQSMTLLRDGRELQLSPAVDAIESLLEVERSLALPDEETAQRVFKVTGVEAAEVVGTISQTRTVGIGQHHEAHGLDSTDGEHEHRGA